MAAMGYDWEWGSLFRVSLTGGYPWLLGIGMVSLRGKSYVVIGTSWEWKLAITFWRWSTIVNDWHTMTTLWLWLLWKAMTSWLSAMRTGNVNQQLLASIGYKCSMILWCIVCNVSSLPPRLHSFKSVFSLLPQPRFSAFPPPSSPILDRSVGTRALFRPAIGISYIRCGTVSEREQPTFCIQIRSIYSRHKLTKGYVILNKKGIWRRLHHWCYHVCCCAVPPLTSPYF